MSIGGCVVKIDKKGGGAGHGGAQEHHPLPDGGIWPGTGQAGPGVKYDVIDRYYKGARVEMADLDFLAKVCYVLDCQISDLLEYERPGEGQA